MRAMAARTGWSLGTTVLNTVAVLAETVILARHFGPAAYGVFLLVLAFPEAVLQVLDLRVREAMNRYLGSAFALDDHPRAVSLLKLFWVVDVAVGLLCFLIVVVAAGPAAELLTGTGEHADLMVIAAFGLFASTLDSAAGTVMRILDRFRLVFFASAIGIIARLLLVIGAVAGSGTLEAVVWARAIAEIVFTGVLAVAGLGLLRRMLWPHRHAPVKALGPQRTEITRFLMTTNLAGTLKMAATKLDTMLIGVLATPATVAVYRFALQFARAPMLLTDALSTAYFPTISRLVALERRGEIRRIVTRTTRLLTLGVVPPTVVAAVLGGEILGLMGGSQFEDGGLVFAICIAGVLPYALLFWQGPVLLSEGRPGAVLRSQAAGTFLQLLLLLVLVPPFGAEGAAVALAAGLVVVVLVQARHVRSGHLLADKLAHA